MAVNTLVATGKTVGSPALGQPAAIIKVALTAINVVVVSPVPGQPAFTILRTLTATGKTVAIPTFGAPLIKTFARAIELSIGTIFFGAAPALTTDTINELPNAQSLWIGPNVFGQPGITGIVHNFIETPQMRVGSPYLTDPHIHTNYPYGGDMRGLPMESPQASAFYREVNAIWPDLLNKRAIISPARNGVNRVNGKILQGWDHVDQSMQVIFATPFHERILRRWVGSFVPYILGETYVQRIVTRFFWAIAVSIDLWEPNYRIKQVHFMGDALRTWAPRKLDAVGEYRLGHGIFRTEGIYRPRAHIGDATPYTPRAVNVSDGGTEIWDPAVSGAG